MQLTIKQLQAIDTDAQWFTFSEQNINKAMPKTGDYSNNLARNNAQLNRISLSKVLEWIQENLEPEGKIKYFPSEQKYSQLWEFINGTAINIGETRLVIIPSEDYDTEEFSVPQEWVDIPELAGDYYLAVQVDLDEKYLRIWGFTSHKTLKEKGDYDSMYRNYSLEKDDMITDLEVFWIAKEMNCKEKVSISSLPQLLSNGVDTLLEKLGKSSPYSPRLEIPFEEWGVLLADPSLRRKLYQERIINSQPGAAMAVAAAVASPVSSIAETVQGKVQKTFTNLSKWLDDKFEPGWQVIDELISPKATGLATRKLKYNFRRKRGKLIDLETSVNSTHIVLMMLLTEESDGKIGCVVQLCQSKSEKYLPSGLALTIINQSKRLFEPVIAREHPRDIYVQSPYIRFPKNTQFQVQLSFNDLCVTEDFTC